MSWVNIALIAGGFGTVAVLADQVWTRHRAARKAARKQDTHATVEQVVRTTTEGLRADMIRRFDENDELTQELKTEVVKIRSTVFPNGGTSLADKVNRVEVSLAELRGEFKASKERK